MSLINDALKKAQHRHGTSTPGDSPSRGPAAIPGQSSRGNSRGKIVLLSLAGAVACIALSFTAALYLLRDSSQPVAPTPVPNPPPSPANPPVVTAPIAPAPPAVSPVVIVETPPAPIEPAAPIAASPVVPAITPLVETTPASAPEPAPPINLGARIQTFIDRLRISGIRTSDTGGRAILNDRLFRENDMVEPSLGLRLASIEPGVLTFTDETGAIYVRRF